MIVTFPSNGGTAEGHLAVPDTGSGPGVVVIQEWWGLVDHIVDVANRLAAAGFVALAPDLYHGAKADEPNEARKLVMAMEMDQAARDIAGAARYLAERAETTGRGIGCLGFCMGGGLALWSATLSEDIVAAVGYYPGGRWQRMSPDWTRYAGKQAMIHCSESDGTCAAPEIQHVKRSIEENGGKVTLFDYPGTHHAFFNETRPHAYNETAAEESWSRTLNFFRMTVS